MSNEIINVECESRQIAKTGDIFLPSMSMNQAMSRYNAVLTFTQTIMRDGKDYGTIPGSDKPCLLKPGAEKLCSFFGLTPKLVIIKQEEDWTGAKHDGETFFYYHYRVQLWKGDYLLGEGDGSCNSMESKYRYRWVPEDQVPPDLQRQKLRTRGGRTQEFAFAIDKAETGGKYGKPAEYWNGWKNAIEDGRAVRVSKKTKGGADKEAWEMDTTLFRVPNPDIADQVNAIQKMAYKRALVAVILIVCNASEYYTQDLDDMELIDTGHQPSPASNHREERQTSQPASPAANGTHSKTNGNGAEPAAKKVPTVAEKVAWFREHLPAMPAEHAAKYRSRIRECGADDDTIYDLEVLWLKRCIQIATSTQQLDELVDEIKSDGLALAIADIDMLKGLANERASAIGAVEEEIEIPV